MNIPFLGLGTFRIRKISNNCILSFFFGINQHFFYFSSSLNLQFQSVQIILVEIFLKNFPKSLFIIFMDFLSCGKYLRIVRNDFGECSDPFPHFSTSTELFCILWALTFETSRCTSPSS